MRVIQALFAAAVVGSMGCAASLPPVAPPTGNVMVVASNHVTSPYTLKSIMVSVDGEQEETTQGKSLQHDGTAPIPLSSVRLRRGQHTLSVRTLAEDRTSDRVISLSVSQSFRVDTLPANITVHVFSPRAPQGQERRIELSFDIQGGAMRAPLGAVASHPTGNARCAELSIVRAAICRTEFRVQEATVARDAILAMCMRDKLLQMRALSTSAEQDDDFEPSLAATRYDAQVPRMTAERVNSIERQLSSCATTDMRAGALVQPW